jgi:transcriptional regulator with XRE-family HTH domain
MHLNPHSLRAIREALGWSVSKFATANETVPGHISNIEAGRRGASPELIRRMARTLNVPVAAITTAYEPEEIA